MPDWSPDGSKIAYAAGDPGDVLVMNADGTDQHTIVGGSTDDFGSAWSPDGGQIAFTRFDDRTVYVADVDGSNVHAVLRTAPGGSRLAATGQSAALTQPPIRPRRRGTVAPGP